MPKNENEWIKQVREFQETFENPLKNYEKFNGVVNHRLELLEEEFNEFKTAVEHFNEIVKRHPDDNEKVANEEIELTEKIMVEMLDALCDMTVINIGTALLLGFDMDKAMREVHRSNMSKLGVNGPLYNDKGKVMKGSAYSKPCLGGCIDSERGSDWIKYLRDCKKKPGVVQGSAGNDKPNVRVIEIRADNKDDVFNIIKQIIEAHSGGNKDITKGEAIVD